MGGGGAGVGGLALEGGDGAIGAGEGVARPGTAGGLPSVDDLAGMIH